MIPAFIMWLVRKYWFQSKRRQQSRNNIYALPKIVKLIILLILFAVPAMAQQQAYRYAVLYKGNNIGNMYLTQQQNGDELFVKITSAIQMRMVMSVRVNVAEEASYKDGKLMYSSVYREVNGKQKTNRQTKYCNGCYEITAEGKKSKLYKTGIHYNLTRLYCKEPVNISQVYSDAFQQFINLKPLGAHKYKLQLPDGNYNLYYYQNGICNKVEVHSTFYTVQMQLME